MFLLTTYMLEGTDNSKTMKNNILRKPAYKK